jgi:hypothetical protein
LVKLLLFFWFVFVFVLFFVMLGVLRAAVVKITYKCLIIFLMSRHLCTKITYVLFIGLQLKSHLFCRPGDSCLIRHTNGTGKCVGLYRILQYSGFILVSRNSLGPCIFVGCHRMSGKHRCRIVQGLFLFLFCFL